jgi:hypothetical protein
VGECTVIQYQYFRTPLADEPAIAEAEAKRQKYADVTYDEDFVTVMGIGRRTPALVSNDDVYRFGRNEMGNQNFHTWLDRLLSASR